MTDPPSPLTVEAESDGVRFWIHVSPRARRVGIGGLHGDALRVAVASPPVEGQANAACVDALADALAVRRAQIELDRGSRARRKRVRVRGDAAALVARLRALAHPDA